MIRETNRRSSIGKTLPFWDNGTEGACSAPPEAETYKAGDRRESQGALGPLPYPTDPSDVMPSAFRFFFQYGPEEAKQYLDNMISTVAFSFQYGYTASEPEDTLTPTLTFSFTY